MKVRTTVAAVVVALAAGPALATDLPPGYGVDSPNGSRFTTTLTLPTDNDDFVFDGYQGARVTAIVTRNRRATVDYQIQLIRPDGTTVTEGDGIRARALRAGFRAQYTLDATGKWKARVIAGDANGTEYSITLRYTGPKLPRQRNVTPDGQGRCSAA